MLFISIIIYFIYFFVFPDIKNQRTIIDTSFDESVKYRHSIQGVIDRTDFWINSICYNQYLNVSFYI